MKVYKKVREMIEKAWRLIEKTHASSPSTSGKTHEKPSVIQTRNEEVSRH